MPFTIISETKNILSLIKSLFLNRIIGHFSCVLPVCIFLFDYTCLCFYFFFLIDKWSPALQIRTVLLSIQALLSAPNPDDPLANDVAEKWKSSEAEAIETGESHDLAWCKDKIYLIIHDVVSQFDAPTLL